MLSPDIWVCEEIHGAEIDAVDLVYFVFFSLICRVGLKDNCESQHYFLCLFGRPTDWAGKE